MPTDRRAALLDRETLRLTSWLRQTGHTIDGRSDGMMEEVVRAALHAVLPDSDAPTPREAALRDLLTSIDAWRQATILGQAFESADEMVDVARRALRSALQAAASTAEPPRRTTALTDASERFHEAFAASTAGAGEGAGGDADAAWDALREAIRWHRGSLGDADPLIEHRPLIEAALRATSETPRETPPSDFGSQIAMRGGLPKDVAARIDAIERGSE